jgi:hypothetical protein
LGSSKHCTSGVCRELDRMPLTGHMVTAHVSLDLRTKIVKYNRTNVILYKNAPVFCTSYIAGWSYLSGVGQPLGQQLNPDGSNRTLCMTSLRAKEADE